MGEHPPDLEQEASNPADQVPKGSEKPPREPLLRQELLDRWIEIVSAIFLALVAVATAWSGYQSTRWNHEQATKYLQASAARVEATRASTQSGQLRLYDVILFNNWLNTYSNQQAELTKIYEKRFRDEFRPAFDAWLATHPFSNPDAPSGPLFMPKYHNLLEDQAAKLEQDAEQFFAAGRTATQNSDDYLLNHDNHHYENSTYG